MKTRILVILCVLVLALPPVFASPQQAAGPPPETPPELVAAYNSVADTILAVKNAEWRVVYSILSTTYNHAEGVYRQARESMQAGREAKGGAERLAALVAQLGNEGDAAVAAVRKRLVEGGHHHNAAGEQQGIYDTGYVIVTKKAKKSFLDAATAIGKLGQPGDAAALDKQWNAVKTEFAGLKASGKR